MATLEQVEKLKERAAVTYDEAKEALNACDGDLLEALIYLEKKGKVTPPQNGGEYSSQAEPKKEEYQPGKAKYDKDTEKVGQALRRFWKWACSIVHKGNSSAFQVWRDDHIVVSLPVTVMVLLLIFCFWVTIPLLVVGLFFDMRYRFVGVERIDMNKVMDSAAEAAENIKSSVKNGDN